MSGECRYPCDCGQFHDEHCSCMDGHTPAPVPSEVAETTAGEREVEALITAAADALMASRLTWSTHADQCVEWQREFWTAVASIILTPALLDRVRREEGVKVLREAALDYAGHDARVKGWLRDRAASVGRGEGQ